MQVCGCNSPRCPHFHLNRFSKFLAASGSYTPGDPYVTLCDEPLSHVTAADLQAFSGTQSGPPVNTLREFCTLQKDVGWFSYPVRNFGPPCAEQPLKHWNFSLTSSSAALSFRIPAIHSYPAAVAGENYHADEDYQSATTEDDYVQLPQAEHPLALVQESSSSEDEVATGSPLGWRPDGFPPDYTLEVVVHSASSSGITAAPAAVGYTNFTHDAGCTCGCLAKQPLGSDSDDSVDLLASNDSPETSCARKRGIKRCR